MEIWKEQVDNVIYHEVGHWVAAKILNFEVGGIYLKWGCGEKGYYLPNAMTNTIYKPSLRGMDEIVDYLKKRSIVAAAGLVCQCAILSTEPRKALEMYSTEDFAKIREFSIIIQGINNPEGLSDEELKQAPLDYQNWCMTEAQKIIASSMRKIEHISKSILKESPPNIPEIALTPEQLTKWFDFN